MLALFLALSDRPLEKSDLDDLEKLKPPPSPPQLTWEEIIRDDPLDEDEIWNDINYAARGSSDEDSFESEEEEDHDESPGTSVTGDAGAAAWDFVVQPELNRQLSVEEAQERLKRASLEDSVHDDETSARSELDVTELMAIREVLLLVRTGHSFLFNKDTETETFRYQGSRNFSQTSRATVSALMAEIAQIARSSEQLRIWTKSRQTAPVVQTFQAQICDRVVQFNKRMNDMEKVYVQSGNGEIVASLLQVCDKVRIWSLPLQRLGRLILDLESFHHDHPYKCLELLYDQMCLTQLAEDNDSFQEFGMIFFPCLRTYLRPLRSWMQDGRIDPDDLTFFVSESTESDASSRSWQDRFTILRLPNGDVDAPSFIQPCQRRIFNAGRSVVFLKALGKPPSTGDEGAQADRNLEFETVSQDSQGLSLLPFSERFALALDDWVRSKHTVASSIVKDKLFRECGLWDALYAFEYLYLSTNGTLMQSFADFMFDKLDSRSRSWSDRFLLTELLQDTFGGISFIDIDRLSVRVHSVKTHTRSMKALSAIVIEYPVSDELRFHESLAADCSQLPWSLANVIRKESMTVYQKVFTFLLQILRSQHLLRKLLFQRQASKAPSSAMQDNKSSNLLRFRLQRFVDILQTYLTVTVFEESTKDMRTRLSKAEDLDAMAEIHQSYIKRLELQCILAKNLQPIHSAILQLLDLSVALYDVEVQSAKSKHPEKSGITAKEKSRRRRSALMVRSARVDVSNDSDSDTADEGATPESEREEHEYDADHENFGLHGPYPEKLRKMSKDFEKLSSFIVVGLKGVGRAGGELCWEMLAERLE